MTHLHLPKRPVHIVIPGVLVLIACTYTAVILVQRHEQTNTTTQRPTVQTPAQTMQTTVGDIVRNNLCIVDARQAPDFLILAQQMARVCQKVFPKIENWLSPSPYPAPHHIVLDYNQYAAYALDGTVHVSIDWLRNDPYDPGVIPHELTHVVQNYDNTAPSWITEGIATYMSFKLGYSIGVAHCNAGESYINGYGCGAALFDYIEREYKPSIVKDVHLKVKTNTYTDAYFTKETGKPLSALYTECLQAECGGGAP